MCMALLFSKYAIQTLTQLYVIHIKIQTIWHYVNYVIRLYSRYTYSASRQCCMFLMQLRKVIPSHTETTVMLRSETSEMWFCVGGRVVPVVLDDHSASIFKGQAMLLAGSTVTSSAAHSYGYKTACS
jgi:hypothetical protein